MNDMTPHKPATRNLLWSDIILNIQDVLLTLNFAEPLYIVGGAVRDAFLHLPIKDIDIAVPSKSIQSARKIANAFEGDIYVMDDERGVARVLIETTEGQLTIDVAAFRGDNLQQDILGRDFTINAMAVDLLGDLQLLIDPLNGEADATQKVIRRCTSASIKDDPIRALRAVRQSTQLKLRIEPETIKDVRQYGKNLLNTSPERVRDELFKILGLKRAPVALKVLDALGFLQLIIPELEVLKDKTLPSPHVFDAWKQAIESVENVVGIMDTISYRRSDSTAASFGYGMLAMQFDRFRAELNDHLATTYPDDRKHTAIIVLATLLHRLDNAPQVAGLFADEFHLSNAEKKRLIAMITHYEASQVIDHTDSLSVHRFWYPIGESGVDAILLGLADYLATYGNELDQDAWLFQVERALMLLFAFYEQHDEIVSPQPFVNGNDLMETLNLDGGRIIGELLTTLREAQVVGEVTSRDEAFEVARAYMQQ